MIKCREAVERLWSYLDRSLERAPEAELEEHLGVCRHCCGELEFAKRVREKLASSADAPMPAETRERVEAFLDRLGR